MVETLAQALAANDVDAALGVFTDDVVFEDMTLRLQLVGKHAAGAFFTRSTGQLPYAGGATVVHIAGGSKGGGFEWRAPNSDVKFGVVGIELDESGLISRLTSVWDGGLVDDRRLTEMMLWSTDVVTPYA